MKMHENLIQAIEKDHKEVQSLLKKIKDMGDGKPKQRKEMFETLKMELIPHMKAEESAFYPKLKEKKEAKEDALEAIVEHQVAETVLKELDKMKGDEEMWTPKFSVLKELIEHHIEEEEEKVFKDTQKTMDHDEMETIFKDFQKQKEKIKKSLS
jgi:hemerythrin superfamily protein